MSFFEFIPTQKHVERSIESRNVFRHAKFDWMIGSVIDIIFDKQNNVVVPSFEQIFEKQGQMARVRWGAMQHSSLWLLFGFVALLSNLRTLRMAEIAVVTSSSLLSTTAFDDSPETWEHQNATIHTLSFFPSTAGVVQLDQHPLGVKNSNENNPFPKEEEENEDEGSCAQ